MLANIMPAAPPSDPWGQNSTFFLEHGHVAYQRELGMQQHVANADRGTKKTHIIRDF